MAGVVRRQQNPHIYAIGVARILKTAANIRVDYYNPMSVITTSVLSSP